MATAKLPATLDVYAIRAGLDGWPVVTQEEFARRFGLSPATVRDWEQRRRKPDAAARALLAVIAFAPAVVEAALRANQSTVDKKIETCGAALP